MMNPSSIPTSEIVINNPDSPNHPSQALESPSRANSFQGEPDDRTPFLNPDQRIKPSSGSRWRDFAHKKRNLIVGLLTAILVVMIVLAFMSWRLFDKGSTT